MRVRLAAILILMILGAFASVPVRAEEKAEIQQSLIISAVMTDGGAGKENIVIHNLSDQKISLEGWQIDYIKPTVSVNGSADCRQTMTLAADDASRRLVLSLTSKNFSEIDAHSALIVTGIPMNDDLGGMVRLSQIKVSADEEVVVVHDLVGWGDDASKPWCYEGDGYARIPKNNQQIMRCSVDGVPSDSDNNAADFSIATASDNGNHTAPVCPQEGEEDTLVCSPALRLSELLPNPAAPQRDAEHEFVEITNSGDRAVSLAGCMLATASRTMGVFLPDYTLLPGDYVALYITDTKLGLSNKGGQVRLIDLEGNVVDQTDPYPVLKSGWSWAIVDGRWQATDQVTPDAPNMSMLLDEDGSSGADPILAPCPAGKYRNPETNRCRNIEVAIAALAPCDEDQERNPHTNRCRNVAVMTSAIVSCQSGYERNASTKRCRKIAGAESGPKPCGPGQERNVETNRCRKIASMATGSKPCDEGQERNPETNRCRKVAATTNTQNVTAVDNNNRKGAMGLPAHMSWWLVGAAVAGVLGYGIYEWRHEVVATLRSLRAKLGKK